MKVYLSSTFRDLEWHRAAVCDALRKAGHEVRAMEVYLAADDRPLDLCREDVAGCDLYVGIFAWRYGFIPERDNPDRKSITELEYDHATGGKIKRLIFLLEEDEPWVPHMQDSHTGENEGGRLITALRARLAGDHTPARFRSREQLSLLVTLAVNDLVPKARPVPAGTIRLPQPWNFDLNALVDACFDRMEDRGLIGMGIPCVEADLLKNFGERLRNLIGRDKAKTRPLQKVAPLYADRTVATLKLCRPQLAQHDVICPVVMYDRATNPDHDINNVFWTTLRDLFAEPPDHRLVVIMGMGGDAPAFPEGVVALPEPRFTQEHVSGWIHAVVEGLSWKPRSISAWKKAMIERCEREGHLLIPDVYNHIEFALQLLQENPTDEAFLASF